MSVLESKRESQTIEPATSDISNNTVKSSPSASVLLVDDEALIRWALSERFSQAGYVVREAGDGSSALAFFREGAPRIDLAVLELQLPDANGIDLLKQTQRLCPACRVILVTAFGATDILQDARDNGAYDLLRKPFDIDHMWDTAQRALS